MLRGALSTEASPKASQRFLDIGNWSGTVVHTASLVCLPAGRLVWILSGFLFSFFLFHGKIKGGVG